MKNRNGFVSNSSSSSFVCDVSGESFEGYDGDYGDIVECSCPNGHNFSSEYLLPATKPSITVEEMRARLMDGATSTPARIGFEYATTEQIEEWYAEEYAEDEDIEPDVPALRCPICMFKKPCDRDIFQYLLRKMNMTREGIMEEMKEVYGSYSTFKAVMKGGK